MFKEINLGDWMISIDKSVESTVIKDKTKDILVVLDDNDYYDVLVMISLKDKNLVFEHLSVLFLYEINHERKELFLLSKN